jgi:hypothetical protein
MIKLKDTLVNGNMIKLRQEGVALFASRYLLYAQNKCFIDIYNIYAHNQTERSVI